MAEDFKVIETQEDLDKIIKERLARKERDLAEKYKDYLAPDRIKDLEAEFEKKLTKANEDLAKANEKIASHEQVVSDLTNRATKAENDYLKSRIAHESGVPFELAGRLVGNTEEELKKDAENFASFLAPKSAPPLHSTDSSTSNTGDLASMLNQINQQFAAQN